LELAEVQEGEVNLDSHEHEISERSSSYQNLICSIQRLTTSAVEFDLVGVDASIANALRRVMIAEVSQRRHIPI
jgi:DNA-directed RNA polymerase alpha subunit